MGVGHHGGGAVGQYRLDELLGRDQGALQMDVGVQEAGRTILPVQSCSTAPEYWPMPTMSPSATAMSAMTELVGEDVDVGGVFQHQIRWFPSSGCFQNAALFQQLPVDLASVSSQT